LCDLSTYLCAFESFPSLQVQSLPIFPFENTSSATGLALCVSKQMYFAGPSVWGTYEELMEESIKFKLAIMRLPREVVETLSLETFTPI